MRQQQKALNLVCFLTVILAPQLSSKYQIQGGGNSQLHRVKTQSGSRRPTAARHSVLSIFHIAVAHPASY